MLYQRDIAERIKKILPREEFIVLTGARQTGKTTMLLILKAHLQESGCLCQYFNLENPDHLKLLNKHPFNIFQLISDTKMKQHIFIDEVQYLDDPANFMKLLYDEKREQVKIIASGSSSFYIDKKFKDSLAGRKFLFEIQPLNFNEFLTFNEEKDLLKQKTGRLSVYYKEKLLTLWLRYLIYGGYPKVVLAKDDETRKILLEEIGSSYVKKDVLDAGIKNTEKYFSLLKILAGQTGSLVNSQELANTLNIAHKTIDEYLYVMRKSYQIAFIKPFYKNIRKELTKMPKVYFYDLGLRGFFLNNFDPPQKRQDKGAFLENVIFRELLRQSGSTDKIKFWRTQDKNEIDFIAENKAFEVKFDAANFKKRNYAEFKQQYPQIKISYLTFKDVLSKFYGWKV